MYAELRAELREIVELVGSLPDKYREKAFDLLVSHLLADRSRVGSDEKVDDKHEQQPPPLHRKAEPTNGGSFVIPARVKTLLRRHKIGEEQLRNLVMIEGQDVHFVHEPRDVRIATGQIHWSLLLALKSALLGRDFLVDPEAVRSLCQDKGFYDAKNFAANFRNNSDLFQRLPQPQSEPVRLSTKGEEELADLIRSLTREAAP
jgi:hypothetical protein